jgi:hypothetical protein
MHAKEVVDAPRVGGRLERLADRLVGLGEREKDTPVQAQDRELGG